MEAVRELGRKWHVELIVWDVTEATAGRRWILKPAKQSTVTASAFDRVWV